MWSKRSGAPSEWRDEDAEELKGSEKITERDRHRWEYDPASAEDYRDRNKKDVRL